MFSSADFWAGVVLPAVVSGAVLLAAWRGTRRRLGARDSRSWAGPLAVGLGFVVGYWVCFSRPDPLPLDAVEFVFYLAQLLAVLGLCVVGLELPAPLRLAAIAAAVLGSLWLLAHAAIEREQLAAVGVAVLFWPLMLSLAVACTVVLDLWAVQVSMGRFGAVMLAAAGPASLALLLSGSQRLGQIGGLLVGSLAGLWAASLVLGPAAIARGTAIVAGPLYAGLLVCGCVYAELTPTHLALLLAAPSLAWVTRQLGRRVPRLNEALFQIAPVLLVSGGVAVAAWLTFVERARE